MVDATTDISSPEYFSKTFGVDAAQATALSGQAKFVGRSGGGGITALAPAANEPSSHGSPAAPGAAVLSAQAEYQQLMADRSSGKITSAEWNATGAKREQALANLIAEGAGTQPAPTAEAPTSAADVHPYLGAPPSPSEYGLLHGEGDLPPEQVAEITAQQEALGRLNLNRSVVQDVHARLRTYTNELQHATPEQVQSVVQQNYSRFVAQCTREGIAAARAEQLVGEQFRQWSTAEPSVRPILEAIAKIGDPRMLDYVLQIALHRTSRR